MKTSPFLLLAALVLALSTGGCDGTPILKMSSCQSDADCPTKDGGKAVCFSLRCVECHYDADCSDGKVCGGNNTCESLDQRATPKADAEKLAPAKNLDECLKRCKVNQACSDDCRDRWKN